MNISENIMISEILSNLVLSSTTTGSEASKNPVDLIKSTGYPVEIYKNVETEDGYLLTIYRIPHGRNNTRLDTPKPVVLLMHGVYGNSCQFIISGPDRSLAYVLSDYGYDVWLGNNRGVSASRKHCNLDPDKDKEYWDFSIHEMGLYDLPAIFNVVQEVTRSSVLTYIGHSQGSLLLSILLSERPNYNERVKLMIALAPVALSPNIGSTVLKTAFSLEPILSLAWELTGHFRFPPMWIFSMAVWFLQNNKAFQNLLVEIIYTVAGKGDKALKDSLSAIMKYGMDTTSVKAVRNYAQMCRTGTLRRFDHGLKENLQIYGKPEPPHYDLSTTLCPVIIFGSDTDYISSIQDIQRLYGRLPNCIGLHEIKMPAFNHFDFLFGQDVFEVVYMPVLFYLKKYGQESSRA